MKEIFLPCHVAKKVAVERVIEVSGMIAGYCTTAVILPFLRVRMPVYMARPLP